MRNTIANRVLSLVDELDERLDERVKYRPGRGGFFGMTAEDACRFLDINVKHADNLPNMVGFYLTDMGGGINTPHVTRLEDMLNHGIPRSQAYRLYRFARACEKAWLACEAHN